ncbi:MAG: ABC-F family ATP-binding cassette domain-containing protein [Deltaproteobacteria bacterium]|nr:ABC-F family ATP-binding cassette domain-containing protein [Deltaproteobacteria bacterium]
MLALDAIAKGFADRTLFSQVSWTVPVQGRIGLVGANGSGKSTFLKILAGEEEADAGRVIRPKGFSVGYLPQEIDRAGRGTVLEETLSGGGEVPHIEARLAAIAEALTAGGEEGTTLDELIGEQAHLHERLEALGGYTLEARARRILRGLGFAEEEMEKALTELSGGWMMRVHLARLLLSAPDLLLLDEPTNHLDLESLQWLEAFLAEYPGTWMVVSHDRYFLDRRVTTIAQLGSAGLLAVPGNYQRYLEVKAERDEHAQRQHAKRQRKVAESMRFVERFRAKATKARQAQSKLKAIEKLEAEPIEPLPESEVSDMVFRLPEASRTGAEVLKVEGLRKAYGEKVVYESLDFVLRRGERIALVGVNGAGKSTLLKILAGELGYEGGSRIVGHNVQLHAYAQHQAEALPVDRTVLEYLWGLMPQENETRVRSSLGAFLFRGDDVDKPIRVLSGGEKARLALAAILTRPVNCLLFDEPTSHLDLRSREVLEQALADYDGALICISHDRYFVNRVCTQVVEVWPGGEIARYPGDYDDYLWKREQEVAAGLRAEEGGAAAAPAGEAGDRASEKRERIARREQEKEERKAAEREERRRTRALEEVQEKIEAAEARMAELDELLCDPGIHADPGRLGEVSREREKTEASLALLYVEWEKLG